MTRARLAGGLALALALAACGGDPTYLPLEELMDPATCQACHPKHFQEWSGSMHAYASEDPVFLAMNARGQRETGGALGDFCVGCHAPMAVRLGLTTDGLNLAEVPAYAKGVTCYFCHSVTDVEGTHNNPLTIASDGVMRGGLRDPVASPAHASAYSPLLDGDAPASSATCGACHDIVTPAGVHLERTYLEWQSSIFTGQEDPRAALSCGGCHMLSTSDVVADVPGLDVPLRQRREHTFPGVDVALTPFPEKDAQLAAIQRDLKGAVLAKLCVQPLDGGIITLRLDALTGHNFPSGASQDRRAWAEIIAYDAADAVVFDSGVVPDGVDPEDIGDPNLWEMRDRVYDELDQPVEFFWEVARVDEATLRPRITNDVSSPDYDHSTTWTYPVPGLTATITRVTARVLIRPLPMSLFDALEASGDLTDPTLRDGVPTFQLDGTVLEWTPDTDDLDRCVTP
ncbi:MAG: multiheme c-type cytochrome [Kofleriaceae bacterium]